MANGNDQDGETVKRKKNSIGNAAKEVCQHGFDTLGSIDIGRLTQGDQDRLTSLKFELGRIATGMRFGKLLTQSEFQGIVALGAAQSIGLNAGKKQ